MYNNGFGAPDITNNPFITDPTNVQTRFPDLSASPGTQNQWPQGSSNAGHQQYQGMYQQPSYQQPQHQLSPGYPQSPGYLSPNLSQGMAPQPTGMPFQPTSSFGQQLAANISGTSYNYLQGQNGSPQQQQTYHPAQQQLQNPGYIAQFDPYSSVGQGWSGETQTSQPANLSQAQAPMSQQNLIPRTPTSPSTNPSGVSHPRDYLRAHKGEIDAWDAYAWKQLLHSFNALKESWEGRAKDIEGKANQLQMQLQYGGGGYHPSQVQQEGSRLQGLHKEAKSHADSVAASSFQMQEVFQGYRQSADVASKSRVREASNAAFQGLPDWPSPLY
ncbi:hypothetical protein C0991_010583 [Blastosporella zonata]|nr:hypothetical protein C0991_010583 [Blastosporella zonata]